MLRTSKNNSIAKLSRAIAIEDAIEKNALDMTTTNAALWAAVLEKDQTVFGKYLDSIEEMTAQSAKDEWGETTSVTFDRSSGELIVTHPNGRCRVINAVEEMHEVRGEKTKNIVNK